MLRRALAIHPLCSGQSSLAAHFSAFSARVQLPLRAAAVAATTCSMVTWSASGLLRVHISALQRADAYNRYRFLGAWASVIIDSCVALRPPGLHRQST